MKIQYLGATYLAAQTVSAFNFWNVIVNVIEVSEHVAAAICGATLITGQVEFAIGACAIAAITAAVDAGAKTLAFDPNTIQSRSIEEFPCSLPLLLNDAPICLSQLRQYVWHNVTSKDVDMAIMSGDTSMSIGINLPSYEFENKDKRDPHLKDMYIEFHNMSANPDELPTMLDIHDITIQLLRNNVLYPGTYRSHLTKPSTNSSMDLLIHTGPTQYKPSFL